MTPSPDCNTPRLIKIEQGNGSHAYIRADAVNAILPIADAQSGQPVIGACAVMGAGFQVLAKVAPVTMAATVWPWSSCDLPHNPRSN